MDKKSKSTKQRHRTNTLSDVQTYFCDFYWKESGWRLKHLDILTNKFYTY